MNREVECRKNTKEGSGYDSVNICNTESKHFLNCNNIIMKNLPD